MAALTSSAKKVNKLLCSRPHISAFLACTLKTKASGGVEYYPPPKFDFWNEGYVAARIYDRTYKRFNENTKVIAVEGSIGVGKSLLAQKIADAFDLDFVRDCEDDDLWIAKYVEQPVDLREYNTMLPDFAQFYTTPMFWNDPNPIKNGKPLLLQYQIYTQRYWEYAKGMCKLFNTGRGFVTDRTPNSDYTFIMAMRECGLLSKEAEDWYTFARANTVTDLWKPHLIVYLKGTREYVRKQIEKRNLPWEKNAVNLNDKFLDAHAKALEEDYVKRMSAYSEVYEVDLQELDINDEEDVALIIEEIATKDLEGKDLEEFDKKFLQWKDGTHNRDSMDFHRVQFSNPDTIFLRHFSRITMPMRMHEGIYAEDALGMQIHVLKKDPRLQYMKNYHPDKRSVMELMFARNKELDNWNMDWPKSFLFR